MLMQICCRLPFIIMLALTIHGLTGPGIQSQRYAGKWMKSPDMQIHVLNQTIVSVPIWTIMPWLGILSEVRKSYFNSCIRILHKTYESKRNDREHHSEL